MHNDRRARALRWGCLLLLVGSFGLASAGIARDRRVVVVRGTLEASLGHPNIHLRLRNRGRVLQGTAGPDMAAALGLAAANSKQQTVRSFSAYLDTGASASVLARSTAERFGVPIVPNAAYHEFGLHGETAMGVSAPLSLELASTTGKMRDEPKAFRRVVEGNIFEINLAAPTGMMALAGEMNVVGMPAIEKLVVEIDPAPLAAGAAASGDLSGLSEALGSGGGLDMAAIMRLLESDAPPEEALARELGPLMKQLEQMAVGPAVRLRRPGYSPPGRVVEVPLTYRDFARRKNPHDMGPLPTLAENPVLVGIRAQQGKRTFVGDWLLDTGAAASIISTKQAQALGIFNEGGFPAQEVAFQLPLGGISGGVSTANGFVIDRLRIAARGVTLEYRKVHVLVHDVAAMLDNGEVIVLDGIFGNNLLLPSAAGMAAGLPSGTTPGPFRMIWVDGPGRRLLLQPRRG